MKLDDYSPFKEKARRVPPDIHKEVRQHLHQMLDLGYIRSSNRPWTSNVLLVRKPSGELRFCIDLRWINQRSLAYAYYLSRIDDTSDTLSGAKYLTSLDLKSGYGKVEMEKEAKQHTALTVGPLGFYAIWLEECSRYLPATHAACLKWSSYQRLCRLHRWHYHLNKDGRGAWGHEDMLERVFQRNWEAALELSPKICRFFQREIKCLGHVVSEDSNACDPSKTVAIPKWSVPSKGFAEVPGIHWLLLPVHLGLC